MISRKFFEVRANFRHYHCDKNYFQANDEAFAKDLQAAIMASKIDMMRDGTKPKDESKSSLDLKKSKKPMAMSLQAFNNMNLNGEVPGDHSNDPNVKDSFFEDVDKASKLALNREQIRESLQQRYSVSLIVVTFLSLE